MLYRWMSLRVVGWNLIQIPQLRTLKHLQPLKAFTVQSIRCNYYHGSGQLHAKKGKKHQVKVDIKHSIDEELLNLDEVNTSMQSCIEKLKQDLRKTITIRTSQGALENISVKTTEGTFPLNQLGQISAKSPHLFVVNLNSKHVKEAASAIWNSGMNLNPKTEGTAIYVSVPQVTKEHRELLIKKAKELCSKTKVDLRNSRSKYITRLRKCSASKDILFKLEKQVSQISENFNENVDSILKEMTKELGK